MGDSTLPHWGGANQSTPERIVSLESFKGELAALSAQYRSGLPDKLADVERLWRDLASGLLHPARMADLQRELHTLAGSAKTFGVPEVGEAAAAAESFLEPFTADATMPGSAGRAEFARLLDALKRLSAGSLS